MSLRHKIDAVKRQHHKTGETPTAAEPSVSDRTLLMTVAAGWAIVAVAVASASASGLVDIVGTVGALLGGSDDGLGYVTSDQSRRLWSASKWAVLAVAMRAARVAVPAAYRAGRRWLAERQAASTGGETLQEASPAPALDMLLSKSKHS